MDALRATLPVLRSLGEGLLQLVYPAVCHVCLESLPSGHLRFCAKCQFARNRQLPRLLALRFDDWSS